MKKIILFTRLIDDNEWNEWVKVFGEQNIQIQGDTLEITKNDITLKVINGKNVLGELTSYIESNPESSQNAKTFINNLRQQIKDENNSETIISIHFGGGVSFIRLNKWLDYLSKQGDINAKYILENFSLPDVNLIKEDKPELRAYGIDTTNQNEIKNWIDNITDNFSDFSKLYSYLKKNWVIELSILKHQIVNLLVPLRIDIEGLIDKEFEDNYWEKVKGAWINNKIETEIFQKVREKIYNGNKDTIEKIVDDRKLRESKSWKEMQNLLPNQNQNLTGDEKVNELLKALSSGDKNKVRQILELYGNVYKQWMDKLINAIDQLKNELGQ